MQKRKPNRYGYHVVSILSVIFPIQHLNSVDTCVTCVINTLKSESARIAEGYLKMILKLNNIKMTQSTLCLSWQESLSSADTHLSGGRVQLATKAAKKHKGIIGSVDQLNRTIISNREVFYPNVAMGDSYKSKKSGGCGKIYCKDKSFLNKHFFLCISSYKI